MTEREIARALAGTELVTVMKGPIAYIKELRQRCVDAELPAMLGACKGKSWGTKADLLVREVDVSRFAHVMQSEWHDMVANEGTAAAPPLIVTADDDSELPCPACGTAAPLVAGACSDCGLQLE